ncbi:hypothetical protein GCM10017655_37770 [Pseudomonas turukhanskensis]|uniref:Uncharacterized protein n=1 Tax=Pseudomonas turukhanskensis TaxID=1806536 RepID=A0A9W6KBX8_9PSED|nr:hypothetical protein GCM10017655_37770 [Pseudomonas turukhanskensis]
MEQQKAPPSAGLFAFVGCALRTMAFARLSPGAQSTPYESLEAFEQAFEQYRLVFGQIDDVKA